ncbi:amidohydrolase family protein [Methanobrevibacter sp.]|uniref:amidohydrolase family protein n=1 Tax=Methanobrevibacter sp. TaxID=66852 RepID=UPI0026DEB49B|nr:amidohydrolase family protein [Methanobrevibacter sp.]MDO5860177.1 amidohydrolase family protein [Methanobrevibacter sp.]
MQKVINSHCHIYPEKIASKAVKGIRDFYDLNMSLTGVVDNLLEDGDKVGVVHYLVHSVATTPKQVKSINEFISDVVKEHPNLFTGFGTLHPDSDDIQSDFDYLLSLGLKGVKLHPDFQRFALNDEKAFKMGEVINNGNVPVLIHCGDYRYNYSNPDQLKPFLDKFPDMTVIGAHFAGWSVWEEATEKLAGTPNLFVDLSSSLYELSSEKAKELIYAYGVDKVLWGTDYPMWESESEMELFHRIGLSEEEENMILYENSAKLLGIK